MLRAMASALSEAGESLNEPERAKISSAETEVRAAIESRTLTRLQRANSALDEATQKLATIVLQKAMTENR